MDRRTSLTPSDPFAVDDREDAIGRAEPPNPAFTGHRFIAGVELVSDEPVAECRVIGVDVDRSVDEMRFLPIPNRDGLDFHL